VVIGLGFSADFQPLHAIAADEAKRAAAKATVAVLSMDDPPRWDGMRERGLAQPGGWRTLTRV
jgi:hypothetical protein